MLTQPDKRTLAALASLEGSPDFQIVREYLEQALQDLHRSTAVTKDEVMTRWQQGAAQAVGDFLGWSTDARTILNRSR